MSRKVNLRTFLRGWTVFLCFALIAIFVWELASKPPAAPTGPPTWSASTGSTAEIALSTLPWLIGMALFIGIVVYSVRSHRSRYRRAWEANAAYQQPQIMEVFVSGLRLTNPLFTTHWNWVAISLVVDAPNLVLLRLSGAGFLMIPKRAANSDQLIGLVEFVRSHLPQPGTFPVLAPHHHNAEIR